MFPRRFLALRISFCACFSFLAGRLVWWQGPRAEELAIRACRQRLAIRAEIGKARGDFMDRNGLPLTGRVLSFGPAALRYGPRPLAAHLLGYVNPGDGRGAAGLEAACDDLLAGGPGRVVAAVVDARGRPLHGLGLRLVRLPAGRPSAVRLSLDRRIQERLEEIADRFVPKGAIVVLSPRTGEILGLVSRPGFDPDHPGDYLRREGAPFMNRATSAYAPGSIFKLVVLAAVLEERPDAFWRLYEDEGEIALGGGLSFHCPEGSHGELTLADALAFSCNTTFIRLGLMLGPDRLLAMAERLGFGTQATRDLPGEDPGELPPAGGLTLGDLANLAIGQGPLRATPLQVARLVAAIANGGYLVTARVLLGVEDGLGRFAPFPGPAAPRRVLSAETARLARAMMAGVVRYGTGRAAAIPSGAAGKTGTAQTGRNDARGVPLSHAWFAGFAPVEDPQYVAVVFLEEGGSGGAAAAPVFRAVMEAVFAGAGTGTRPARGT